MNKKADGRLPSHCRFASGGVGGNQMGKESQLEPSKGFKHLEGSNSIFVREFTTAEISVKK